MNYTLSDFLSQKIVPEIRLITKKQDFSKIPVRSASVQELPPENLNFVRPDEIVLSTGIGWEENPGCLLELIRGAGHAHAAAVIFSLRTEPVPFPGEAISFADSIDLPVFLMPWKQRFSVVQSALQEAILENRLSIFKEIQNTLFNDFFESVSLEEAACHISEVFKCPAEIVDSSGHIFAKAGTAPDSSGLSLTESPIRIGNDHYGFLRIFHTADADSLFNDGDTFEKYVAFPLSLWFNRKKIEDLTTARIRNDFVWNLAAGNYASFEETVRQGRSLGYDLAKPYTCLVLQGEFPDYSPVPGYSQQAALYTEQAEGLFAEIAQRMNLAIIAAGLNMKFTLFLERTGKNPVSAVFTFIDAAEAEFQKNFPSIQCFWGISEPSDEICDFKRLYRNASLALQYSKNEKGDRKRFTYKDTKKALIVSALAENPQIRDSAKETLGKLLEHDQSSGSELLHTLTELIRCNYNISQTARNLHIHRQSLLYRMEKIEELTGMSLNSHDDLFLLEIFTRIFVSY